MNNYISDDEEGEAPHVTGRSNAFTLDAHSPMVGAANIPTSQPGGPANFINAS